MRDLAWDGYVNVRDLGGLPTPESPSGATVPGRVARGPRRELLTTAGWVDAHAWGVRTVVDLRCAYEAGPRDTDPPVDAAAWDGVTVLDRPTEDHANLEFREVCFPVLDSPAYWRPSWRILPGLVRAALVAIADAEPGVLVHCSAGRDRTGMITTLLLANAGVPPEHVAQDYAASVRVMARVRTGAPTSDPQAGWDEEQVERRLAEILPIVLDVAREHEAAFDALDVDRATRTRLRELLTL